MKRGLKVHSTLDRLLIGNAVSMKRGLKAKYVLDHAFILLLVSMKRGLKEELNEGYLHDHAYITSTL